MKSLSSGPAAESSPAPPQGVEPAQSRLPPEAALGNAYMNQLVADACVDHGSTASDGRLNEDPSLDPLYDAVNHPGLDIGDRAQLMLNYRNSQLAEADLLVLNSMRNNEEGMPLWATGDDRGMQMPLYNELASDPNMQAMMTDLSSRILSTDQEDLDIEQIFSDTQAQAMTLAGEDAPNAETNLEALQAMATLVNYYKFEGGGPPPEIADQLPEGLWDQIHAAGEHLSYSTSPDAAVMSHGVQAAPGAGNFTADRNFHFFSHAYLSASLQQEHGVNADWAEATSGYLGSQYELLEGSLRENQGNSGIKDILVNAEGVAFGTQLMNDPCATLPGQMDGPPIEDRSLGTFAGDLPADAQAVVDEANDMSVGNMLWNGLLGVFGVQDEVEIPARPGGGEAGNGHTPPSLSH